MEEKEGFVKKNDEENVKGGDARIFKMFYKTWKFV